jgi:hypothetical protein
MKSQYVYIGQYYHIKSKELPLDYKFGVTDNLDQREYSLSRTKSPIKYMILKAWEIPMNVNREKVEKLIATIFDENKYDGCEWYDIDGETFQGKISTLFQIISDMVNDGNFNFTEVDLNKSTETVDIVEKEMEKEIRTGKKSPWCNLIVEIDGINLSVEGSAKNTFVNFINKILEDIDIVQLAIEFPKILKSNKEDFAEYKRGQVEKIGDFYLDTHSSTSEKKKIISDLISYYKINGVVFIK